MEGFEQVYEFYFQDVYRYVLSLCHDPGEAEEITQETFCQALKSIDSFRGDCKMTVWLCQIAKHIFYGKRKKERYMSHQPLEEAGEDSASRTMEQRLMDEGDAMDIHRHLHRLKEPYKEVFMLRVFGELSFQKISSIFGKTESWARVTYHRARLKLMSEMEERDG